MSKTKTSYDAIPYPTVPFPESHPDRLAAIARLFGMVAPAAATCRVLELGCSTGGNLLAIAQMYPQSRCLGIDASANQVADGWKTIGDLGAKNIELRHLDILDVGDNFGEFDYIISHGVYSWVPEVVQNKMLDICRRHLARNGVAYISYNTYPGWHIRGIVRDMMFYRGMQFADPPTQLSQAKSLVEFVSKSSVGEQSPYRRLLESELEQLGRMSDHYLHHEYLEEHNQPIYFHQFAKKLSVNGLQFLGEAEFSTMISTNFSPEVAATLHQLGAHDIVQMEQYMDFVRCRYFRKTLICHTGHRLNREIDIDAVKHLLLASSATAKLDASALAPGVPVIFESRAGNKLTCKATLTKLAMRALARNWPTPMTFADLFAQCTREVEESGLQETPMGNENFLASELLTGMCAGTIEWRVAPPPFSSAIDERPATTALARLQATQGYRVTNLRGESVTLDEIHRQTLRHLDGTTNRERLTELLMERLRAGEFTLFRENDRTPVAGETEMRELLVSALDKVLVNLARHALFFDAK
jgi:methyltransferase-like protein/SAM-dependent methyltransferase